MLQGYLDRVKSNGPLVHAITNYVTVNDVANAILAVGGAPVMADAVEEVGVFAGGSCLYLNLGTLNSRTVDSMLKAGRAATMKGTPIVLDPVGVGATPMRTETAHLLLRELGVTVLRGNSSEIRALSGSGGDTRGVDVGVADVVTEQNLPQAAEFAAKLAQRLGLVVSFSGPIDVVSDGKKTFAVRGGDALMPRITGSGCMLSGVVSAFVGASPNDALGATVAAYALMSAAGERARGRMRPEDGTGSFRAYLMDALFTLDEAALSAAARVQQL